MIRVALAVAAVAVTPTAKVVFTPFHGSLLARGIAIERTAPGYCTYGSEIVKRWDAWSCRTRGGRVYDPCFSNDQNPRAPAVACLASPWSNATMIELTRKLPQALANVVGDPRTHAPWALVLATRERCVLTRGLGTVAGARVTYACAGAAVLVGVPDRSHAVWTIRRAATAKATTTRRVGVVRAYW